ncbi:MAG: Two-component transcriptional response regulator, LuxR family [Burkholderiaceae bacterium]|jgi:DNA-binding NarL/FixJ family response regulator|nr:MAG: Two-component transcriptional response regulator, LuxR family [Burkholderiaceae bacterium]
MIRVAIIDDHALVRAGLRQFLGTYADIDVVAEAGDGRGAMEIVRGNQVDVLLLDIALQGESGVDVLAAIKARVPDLPVLILSGFPERHYATYLMRQGAAGYLGKTAESGEIAAAIRTAAVGRRYITPAVAELLATNLLEHSAKAPHELLSEREFQVFLRLAKGATVGQVADSMALSAKTVSTYRARIAQKLKLSSNSDLTYYALKNGLVE